MMSLSSRQGLPFACAAALAAVLAACAPPRGLAAGGAVDVRVLVKLVHGSEDAAAIRAEAARLAGVPVSYAAAVSPSWHALALHCADAAQCAAAIDLLRGAGATYQAVEIEGRKAAQAS
ncbi:MAG: hypothetical protein ABI364_09485 [Caldimonas sp.]